MGIYDYTITNTHYYTAAVSNYSGKAFFPFFFGSKYFILSSTNQKLKLKSSHWPISPSAKAETEYGLKLAGQRSVRLSMTVC